STYVKLDGEIGILGNGAGLVMSTLDVIDQVGGRPANFCDLGGGGDAEGVVDALEVITADAQVEAILFNIFGGITRGDEVARGILEALERMSIDLPIVVRLDGTNAAEGRAMLAEAAPPNLYVEGTMLTAAERVPSGRQRSRPSRGVVAGREDGARRGHGRRTCRTAVSGGRARGRQSRSGGGDAARCRRAGGESSVRR